MTTALCLHCGELKLNSARSCSSCSARGSGNPDVDDVFTDQEYHVETLKELGEVIRAIRRTTTDAKTCHWAFLLHDSKYHPSILVAEIEPQMHAAAAAALSGAVLPSVRVRWSLRARAAGIVVNLPPTLVERAMSETGSNMPRDAIVELVERSLKKGADAE